LVVPGSRPVSVFEGPIKIITLTGAFSEGGKRAVGSDSAMRRSVFGLVIASVAAGAAIKQSIAAESDILLRLAKAAIPVAMAFVFVALAV
jgi:hypothetical protein